jgi:hypothetical protein
MGRYSDYEHPVAILSDIEYSSKCKRTKFLDRVWRDSWIQYVKQEEKDIDGRTFSLMPWPGLQSRPDRIFINSDCLKEHEVVTMGKTVLPLNSDA